MSDTFIVGDWCPNCNIGKLSNLTSAEEGFLRCRECASIYAEAPASSHLTVEGRVPASPRVVGYHLREIPKGKLGKISKIEEELLELKDAREQRCKLMELQELSDLYGAIEVYLKERFSGFSMQDLKHMAKITTRAFESGERCSR